MHRHMPVVVIVPRLVDILVDVGELDLVAVCIIRVDIGVFCLLVEPYIFS